MRIFNEAKTEELLNPDMALGHLEPDTLIIHIEAVEAIAEQSHVEVIARYPNGGIDEEKIIDVPAVDAVEAHDEIENIMVYIPYSAEELQRKELQSEKTRLQAWLKDHDYIGTKIATGRATIANYTEEIEIMTEYAERINVIEGLLNNDI